jgi:hypothetical protein
MLGSSPVTVGRENAISLLRLVLLTGWLLAGAGCRRDPGAAFTDLAEARRLTADLRVEFAKASDASNRAVMADTDEASVAFAHEAEQATHDVESDVAALGPHLRSLQYKSEQQILDAFTKSYTEYRKLDQVILALAVENTNLKAQRLSFGPAREAADGFRAALDALGSLSKDRCRFDPLVAKAVIAVREVQVLQAPHIAEADDAAMTRMETEMAGLEVTANDALTAISGLVDPKGRTQLAAASTWFDRFKDVSRQIVALSRRNTNVRSLELSLREKPGLTVACDDSLSALDASLAKERLAGTR